MSDTAPAKPILALTLALAGKRVIKPDPRTKAERLSGLHADLTLVFETIAARLDALHEAPAESPSLIDLRFDTQAKSRLTLVTGLADGSDQIASEIFLSDAVQKPSVERVLGAVLPCDREAFIAHSKVDHLDQFEAVERRCEFIIELDGEMPASPGSSPKPEDPPEPEEIRRDRLKRGRAFAAQAEVLLRQCDILVAVDDPAEEGKIGGTRQTVRTALELGIPVVLLRLGDPGVFLLRARGDLDEPGPRASAEPAHDLWRLVDRRLGLQVDVRDPVYVKSLLKEFHSGLTPNDSWPGRLWDTFQKRFEPDGKNPPSGTPAGAYVDYRSRASTLGGYYASRYRGAFLVGYFLAVLAVALAVTSLLIILFGGHAIQSPHSVWWWVVLILGFLKLAAVAGIAGLAEDANRRRLAHKAADYRYLAERLRAMIFLPAAGSMRAPNAWSQPYTTRVTAQGVIDRMFFAVERQARPLDTVVGTRTGATVRLATRKALDGVRRTWIASQRIYHERASHTQAGLSRFLEVLSRRLNQAVIAIVAIDLLVTGTDAIWPLPGELHEALHKIGAPVLIAVAAILPAAVASLNGIRFQSECTRVADRSRHLAGQLLQLEHRADRFDPGETRILDALRLGEDMARLANDEVAEWSAIYGKDFVEM